jgi:hypothetical protein
MHHSRKLFALSLLFSSLILFNPHTLLAQSNESPIIALSNNNIYAVSPIDGEAHLLLERSATKDEALANADIGVDLYFSPISPDNTKFAYTAPLYEVLDPAFESKLADIANISPTDLTLVDIATGELTPITDQAAHITDAIEHDKLTTFNDMTWSIDGQRLYFVSHQQSMHNRVPQTTIEYYDVEAGTRQVLTKVQSQGNVMHLYSVEQGIVLMDGDINRGSFTFTLYNPDGEVINSFDFNLSQTMDCPNGLTFGINPVLSNNAYHYGYYTLDTGHPIPTLLDVETGNSTPLDYTQLPAFMSHTNRETSLRVVYTNMCYVDESDVWTVTDAEGLHMTSMPLTDLSSTFRMALSPQGETIAYIKPTERPFYEPSPIVVMDENGSHELDFEATEIIWGATDFTFAPIIYRG